MRSKIFYIIDILLFFIVIVISIISSNFLYLYLLLLFWVITLIYKQIEIRHISKKFLLINNENNMDEAISFCQKSAKKCFVLGNYYACLISLTVLYMQKDELDKAHELINNNPRLKKNKSLSYAMMILALVEDDMDQANYYYEKVKKNNKPIFYNQKMLAVNLMTMVENKEFSEEVYTKTTYPVLKRLCLKYKKEEE